MCRFTPSNWRRRLIPLVYARCARCTLLLRPTLELRRPTHVFVLNLAPRHTDGRLKHTTVDRGPRAPHSFDEAFARRMQLASKRQAHAPDRAVYHSPPRLECVGHRGEGGVRMDPPQRCATRRRSSST